MESSPTPEEEPVQRVVTEEEIERFLERQRQERDELKLVDPLGYHLATKKGANVINGGRKKTLANQMRSAYARAKKRNGGKFGRYTKPKPRKATDAE